MAVQYIDGSFSETVPMDEARRLFDEALEADMARALYAGTPEQIQQIKEEKSAKEMIRELQCKVAELEAERRGIIHRPNYNEMKRLGLVDLDLAIG